MLEVRDLHKAFGGQQVLRGVSLFIPKGRTTAIIGRSGTGKSVLLKHLIRLLRPDRGHVLVDGVDVVSLRGRALDRVRARFGVLFQGGALFDSMTAFDNVAFPLREKTRLPEPEVAARVRERLDAVGLADMGHKFPAEISGGMRKRVAFARALVTDPEIVLFDEPTTGLDPIMLNAIHRLIADTQKRFGFTGVVVSHDVPDVFEIAHQVAMLHDGTIVAAGPPDDVLRSDDPRVRQFIAGSTEGPLRAT